MTQPDPEALGRALSMVEIAVADMAEAGLQPMQIAIALAWHMNKQAEMALPNPAACALWKAGMIA